MQPFTISQRIDQPVAVVFDYLSDLANYSEFTEHFLTDWRMTREETFGLGAGGRFHEDLRFDRFGWGDMAIVEYTPPRLIVLVGCGGKYNRIRTLTAFELSEDGDGGTAVTLTVETRPVFPSDRIVGALGQDRARQRGWRKAMKRLSRILEHDRDRGPRATISGGARKPATGLRA
ncbi:MAG: SRPBCC family protein [Solirubrobacterales bacterium]|nr:SRPBCC family protein [Solirubrobacterales bacterium]